jgi:hypothetical protein
MRRRELLRAGAGLLGSAAVLGSGLARPARAHPGPYEPYGRVDLAGAKEAVVSPDGATAFVATTTGYATVDVSVPDRPRVLADVREPLAEREAGPLRGIQDVKLDADRDLLVVVGPANPLPGALAGVLVVDVSDPAAPRAVAFHETSFPVHNCDVADGHAYLTAADGDRNPLVVLDVRGDEPTVVGRWSVLDADERWSVVPATLRPLHDVHVRGDRAYCSLWDAGTWLLDVSDPADPVALGRAGGRPRGELAQIPEGARRRESTEAPGNAHSAATDESGTLLAVGRESWATAPDRAGPSGIDLYDVSDPAAPVRRATVEPPPTPDPTYAGVWTTAHNFELRDDRLYSAWYQGGVKRHDVSDPSTPRELSWWRDHRVARFWTARLAVPGSREGFFVAPSMGVGDVPARLYTFPDHAGTQADPPALNATDAGADAGAGADDGAGVDVVTPSGSPPPTPTPEPTESSGAVGVSAPGLGWIAGAAGLGAGVGALGLRRRLRRRGRDGGADDSGSSSSSSSE